MAADKSNGKSKIIISNYIRFCRAKALASLLLLVGLVYIALYVRDTLIRPVLGDVLVVIWLYFLLSSFLTLRTRTLIFITLSIAFSVELAQYLKLPKLLGIEPGTALSTILGTTFDWLDLIAYITGAVICMVIEWILNRRTTGKIAR